MPDFVLTTMVGAWILPLSMVSPVALAGIVGAGIVGAKCPEEGGFAAPVPIN